MYKIYMGDKIFERKIHLHDKLSELLEEAGKVIIGKEDKQNLPYAVSYLKDTYYLKMSRGLVKQL